MKLPYKDPSEVKRVEFSYRRDIAQGGFVTRVDRDVISVDGADSDPFAILIGEPTIDGQSAYQFVGGGLDACVYELRFLATDNSGQKHMIAAELTVKRQK